MNTPDEIDGSESTIDGRDVEVRIDWLEREIEIGDDDPEYLEPGEREVRPAPATVSDQENRCERPEDPDRYQGSHEQQRSDRTGLIAGEGDPFTKGDHRQV